MESSEVELQQVRSLLQAIYERYGFDFRDYADASMTRRILQGGARRESGQHSAVGAQAAGRFRRAWSGFWLTATVNVTSMFRDPGLLSCRCGAK